MNQEIQIIAFYEFKLLSDLPSLRLQLREALLECDIRGSIIIASEGYNGMVCGSPGKIADFVEKIESVLETTLNIKSSFSETPPFRKVDVKIKPEIVTLKRDVDISLGHGTHVSPTEWNKIIVDPDTFVLDARNDYEYQSGTFQRAVNPETEKFSDLPAFVTENLDPDKHKRIAMFCTGGIRCEKLAPYLKQQGFIEVYQLKGGILKYLEETPVDETLWQGECFVFDERVTVDANLQKGSAPDHSQRLASRKKERYKVTR